MYFAFGYRGTMLTEFVKIDLLKMTYSMSDWRDDGPSACFWPLILLYKSFFVKFGGHGSNEPTDTQPGHSLLWMRDLDLDMDTEKWKSIDFAPEVMFEVNSLACTPGVVWRDKLFCFASPCVCYDFVTGESSVFTLEEKVEGQRHSVRLVNKKTKFVVLHDQIWGITTVITTLSGEKSAKLFKFDPISFSIA
jgi:hypothetical protein